MTACKRYNTPTLEMNGTGVVAVLGSSNIIFCRLGGLRWTRRVSKGYKAMGTSAAHATGKYRKSVLQHVPNMLQPWVAARRQIQLAAIAITLSDLICTEFTVLRTTGMASNHSQGFPGANQQPRCSEADDWSAQARRQNIHRSIDILSNIISLIISLSLSCFPQCYQLSQDLSSLSKVYRRAVGDAAILGLQCRKGNQGNQDNQGKQRNLQTTWTLAWRKLQQQKHR